MASPTITARFLVRKHYSSTAGEYGNTTYQPCNGKGQELDSSSGFGVSVEELVNEELGAGTIVEVTVRVVSRKPLRKNPWWSQAQRRRTRTLNKMKKEIGSRVHFVDHKPRRVYEGVIEDVTYEADGSYRIETMISQGLRWGGFVYHVRVGRRLFYVCPGSVIPGPIDERYMPPGDDGRYHRFLPQKIGDGSHVEDR